MSATTTQAAPRSATIPSLVALGAGLLALIAVFWPECQAAVKVWTESTAYGHCFLVAPIAAYLAWDRRDSLRGLVPRPTPLFALLALPAPFAWFAAERMGIMEGRQLVVIGLMELLFLVMLGWRLFYALLGPLLYLVFLVPFGAFLTPVLQSFTAHFIDIGLTVLGISHYVSDMLIEISAGSFYVAEACAGLRFLIASIAFGVFFALLNYRSPGRRAGFMVASIVIPIIANGLRALGIVLLGHVLGSAEAAAADHIIYGWVFFSFVMLLLVAAGLPFREGLAPPPEPKSLPPLVTASHPWGAILVVAVAALGPAAAMALDRNAGVARLAAVPALVAPEGCQVSPGGDAAADAAAGRAVFAFDCDGRAWIATIQALPARSAGSALSTVRRRLSAPEASDDMAVGALPDAPGWQLIITREPSQVGGIAVWIDGRPAGGGLAQRLRQARNSILGASHEPLVIAVSHRSPRELADRETKALTAELSRIVAAQSALAAAIPAITAIEATSSPPPRP